MIALVAVVRRVPVGVASDVRIGGDAGVTDEGDGGVPIKLETGVATTPGAGVPGRGRVGVTGRGLPIEFSVHWRIIIVRSLKFIGANQRPLPFNSIEASSGCSILRYSTRVAVQD